MKSLEALSGVREKENAEGVKPKQKDKVTKDFFSPLSVRRLCEQKSRGGGMKRGGKLLMRRHAPGASSDNVHRGQRVHTATHTSQGAHAGRDNW